MASATVANPCMSGSPPEPPAADAVALSGGAVLVPLGGECSAGDGGAGEVRAVLPVESPLCALTAPIGHSAAA